MTPAKAVFTFLLILSIGVTKVSATSLDKRGDVLDGKVECLEYDSNSKTFTLTCGFEWKKAFQDNSDDVFISLKAGERFAGNDNYIIDLTGIKGFKGMFTTSASSFDEAPIISNVHVRNGFLSEFAGYILKQNQQFFVVEYCSSSGGISGTGAGGIAGYNSGWKGGKAQISNCWSSGAISALSGGGIAGNSAGAQGGNIVVEDCSSSGEIGGRGSGGIAGGSIGRVQGASKISRSFSTGTISGPSAGGITGKYSGWDSTKRNQITKCYSLGDISGDDAGGITGGNPGDNNGVLSIDNSFSRGDITGSTAGGITGEDAGNSGGAVSLTNTYASGNIMQGNGAAGLFGSVADNTEQVKAVNSVYSSSGSIAAAGTSNINDTTGTSDKLTSITGTLYYFDGVQKWEDTTWTICADSFPVLKNVNRDSVDCVKDSSESPSVATPKEGEDDPSLSVVLPVVLIICLLLCVVFLFLRSRRNRSIQDNPHHACASQLELPKRSIALVSEWNGDSEVNANQVQVTESTVLDDSGQSKGTPSIVLIPPDEFHSVSVRSISGDDPKSILRSEASTANAPLFVTFANVLEGGDYPLQNRVKLLYRKVTSYTLGDTSPLVVVNLQSRPSAIQVEGS